MYKYNFVYVHIRTYAKRIHLHTFLLRWPKDLHPTQIGFAQQEQKFGNIPGKCENNGRWVVVIGNIVNTAAGVRREAPLKERRMGSAGPDDSQVHAARKRPWTRSAGQNKPQPSVIISLNDLRGCDMCGWPDVYLQCAQRGQWALGLASVCMFILGQNQMQNAWMIFLTINKVWSIMKFIQVKTAHLDRQRLPDKCSKWPITVCFVMWRVNMAECTSETPGLAIFCV